MESKGFITGSQALAAEEKHEEPKEGGTGTEAAKEDDLQLRYPGPKKPEDFVKEQSKDFKAKKNWFAVYSFAGTNYQWKWNEENKFWYWNEGKGKGWKKGSRDPKGKEKCEARRSNSRTSSNGRKDKERAKESPKPKEVAEAEEVKSQKS